MSADPAPTPTRPNRLRTLDDATVSATHQIAEHGGCAVVLRRAGPRGAVLALAGTFDRADRARLRALVGTVGRAGTEELVVDLGGIVDCDDRLARTLTHLRMRLLVGGIRVWWRRVPSRMAGELGAAATEAFAVTDAGPAPVATR